MISEEENMKVIRINRNYVLQIWIFTIALSTISLFLWFTWLELNYDSADLFFCLTIFVLGLFCSLPTLIICNMLFEFVLEITDNPIIIKLVIGIVSTIGASISLYLFFGMKDTNLEYFGGIYSVNILIASLTFKIIKTK